MARPRTTKSGLSREDLLYLAGIFEATLGIRGVGTNGAVGISNTEEWPRCMAETYGGVHRQFTSAKTEKSFWGWYVTISRRLELVNLLKEAEVVKTFSFDDWINVIQKLERAVNSGKGDLGG
jgi:hypothetical protein